MRVNRTAEFALTVERSRFYALLTPLSSGDLMEALLKERRRDYRKAVHHCWAYRLTEGTPGTQGHQGGGPRTEDGPAVVEVSKDDGEVGHPGRVLLELLRKYDLEGALVVSRIFGGVKLGVGGVSRAFREAGQGAINGYLAG